MRHVDVQSTLIHSVSYDPLTGTLEVQFQDGNTYRFYEVEPEVYEELLDAPTKGRYFNDYIRDAYLFTRLM